MKHDQSRNLPLWSEKSVNQNSIDYWIENLSKNELVTKILNTDAFLRLENISFLGALDYTCKTKGIEKRERSRAQHSIFVAAIANYVASKRNYSEELTNHVIAAALLHDIGHPPLSHSAEPFIKKSLGYGHHEAGEQIITGEVPLGKELSKALHSSVDINFILNLINGEADANYGGDLFYSSINIDTIDGILRSHKYITGLRPSLNHLSVADASFFDNPNNEHAILDEFWCMKERVYSGLINNELGLLSDKTSEVFFMLLKDNFREEDIYTCENAWKKKYKGLFKEFSNILKKTAIPEWLLESEVTFIDRQYLIKREENSKNRYKCIKQTKLHSFKDTKEPETTSLRLFV
ncbi:HD domain-containing protein [Pseudomonas sp. NPDC088414]|uniref:HD domain-containing protein n=1 Tax=Pseudomonas sp. NPDC088414 TaxID=3364454 RepID=UPI0037FBB897